MTAVEQADLHVDRLLSNEYVRALPEVVPVVVNDPALIIRDALVDFVYVRKRHLNLSVPYWTECLASALDQFNVYLKTEALFYLFEITDVLVLQFFSAHAVEITTIELVCSRLLTVKVNTDFIFF